MKNIKTDGHIWHSHTCTHTHTLTESFVAKGNVIFRGHIWNHMKTRAVPLCDVLVCGGPCCSPVAFLPKGL